MLLLLLRVRLRGGWNLLCDAVRQRTALSAGFTLLGVGLFGSVLMAFYAFFHFAARLGALEETVYQVFYFLLLFLLAGAVPFVASTLLHSADYGLLFSSPLPPRAIVAAKLLDATLSNSIQFTVLGIPAIAACAAILNLNAFGWLLILPLTALFVLLPALATALGLLLALAALGMHRLRAAVSLLNALLAIAVCITVVLESGHMSTRVGALQEPLSALGAGLSEPSRAAHLLPSAWFARTLLALSGQATPATLAAAVAPIGATVCALYGLCVLLGARLLTAANVAEDEEGAAFGSHRPGLLEGGLRLLLAAPTAAIVGKDLRYVRRDTVLLSQLGMPLILFLVPFLLAAQQTGLTIRENGFPFATGMIAIILFMQTSILSLSSIGLEGRSFWIVRGAPVRMTAVLRAKFALAAMLCICVSGALSLVAGAVCGVSLPALLSLLGVVVMAAAGLCAIGVGISASFPRFLYENPAHRVSAWALILGFFASLAYVMGATLLFGCAWFFAMRSDTAAQAFVIYGVAWLLFAGATLLAILPSLLIGARRLEQQEWDLS